MKNKSSFILFAMCALFVCVFLVVTLAACNLFGQNGCMHDWQEATCQHPKACRLCGVTEGEKDLTAHTFNQRVENAFYLVSEANCVTKAVYNYSCVCGAKGTNTFAGDTSDANHAWGEWQSNGDGTHIKVCKNNKEHFQTEDCTGGVAACLTKAICDVCGDEYGEILQHIGGTATCLKKATCDLCGKEYGNLIPYHSVVEDKFVPATFGKSGLTKGLHCEICGFVFTVQKELKPLNSVYTNNVIYVEKVEGRNKYQYEYSLKLGENNSCTVVESKGMYSPQGYHTSSEDSTFNGTILYEGNGYLDSYKVVADGLPKPLYVVFSDSSFEFVNSDGTRWFRDMYFRPIGTTQIPLTPRKGNGNYGYNDLANNTNGEAMQNLYRRLYDVCEQFIDSDEDIDTVIFDEECLLDSIKLSDYGVTNNEARAVWKVFYYDNPRYYWLSNGCFIYGDNLQFCINCEYASASYRKECDMAIEDMVHASNLLLNEEMSELETALVLHDFVIVSMNYAYKDDGVTPEDSIWAHNMIGTAKHKLGVCEAYAKSYFYLCKLNNIDCLIVTGDTVNGELHAWNLVYIDGEWYGVDCTWDDNSDDEFVYRSYFGIAAYGLEYDRIAETPIDEGMYYLYELPACSTKVLLPVELYENGEYIGLYADLDSAFGAMTDENGVYDIKLPYMFYYVLYTQFAPIVKSINIEGYYFEYGDVLQMVSSISVRTDLYLNCDLTLTDIVLEGDGSLNLQNHTLTFEKHYSSTLQIYKNIEDANNAREDGKVEQNEQQQAA